ncbi:uncharacterized protein LOC102076123 isoform X3 [Oreochromis niloticus]|uniref:uncharacterized protein LOC102076123 isoform X3 n=1 Tax=Oreochromis niloticus TaxID=8128 RepID=UPI00039458EE|nr:uncharacterized protein LOC102076123 isoform X3 [Oreochromis niloticus]
MSPSISSPLCSSSEVDGEMWCYQKPGFDTLLLTELQRQQQCSQFCDTLLKAEGVSIPAHSCILSAISPHISSALSSTPTPAAGQSRLLEFRALGACTLLHLVRLLYSGEMAGEGEREKQQAISAAAKLGIHGLVEVTKRECKSRDGVAQCAEIGVQTEPLMSESEGRPGRWRREVRDGSTFLWKEIMSDGGKDVCTQTDELELNTAPPAHPAVSFETIDMSALQSIQHTDPLLVPPQIVPVSVVYPQNELTPQLSSAPLGSISEAESTSVAVVTQPYTSVPPSLPHFMSQTTICNADPQSGWADQDVAVAEEWEEEQFKQFQGNIPGFISYFLNPDSEEEPRRGRAGRRRRSGVGGARRAETGKEKPGRPRAGGRGRGRGGLTQMVQEVGVSRLQKLFLLRWGMRTPRTGQGGGAAGRKLCLQTREVVKKGGHCERRRGRGIAWALSQVGDVLRSGEVGGSTTQRGRKNTGQQFEQGSRPVRPRRSRAKTATSTSFFPTPMQFTNAHTVSTSSHSFQASPSPHLPSPAASYASPPSCLPVPAPPPHEEQPEQIDRLLEEVMMGLDILPNNKGSASHAQHPLPAGSNTGASASSEITSSQNKPQSLTSELRESTEVAAVAGAAGRSSPTNGVVPVLDQPCEGELGDMLDQFLQSFEQHVESCRAREEMETSGVSSTETCQPHTLMNTYKKNKDHTTTPYIPQLQKSTHRIECSQTPELHIDENESQESRSQSRKAHAGRTVSPKRIEETRPTSKRQNKRRLKPYLFSLEKKRVKVRKPDDAVNRNTHARKEKQLKQIPVVNLERRDLLPAKVATPGHICQNLEGKGPEETKNISSIGKNPHGGFLKIYPIRSRLREPQIPEPLTAKRLPSAVQSGRRRRGRPRKNDPLSSSNRECSKPPILAQPADFCVADEQLEKNQERHEEELAVQPHEEVGGPTRRGQKRGAESDENTSDNSTVAKRACFETPTQPPASEPADFTSKLGATDPEEIIDVETVSLTGDCLQEEKENLLWSELRLAEGSLTDEEVQSSADEIIDVDGDDENMEMKEEIHCQSRTAPTVFADLQPSVSPSQSANGSWDVVKDEVIDVIGGSSPVPEPVTITWTESSEGEEEGGEQDVDVVGEHKDSASSVIFTAVIKDLVKRNVQTEVHFH